MARVTNVFILLKRLEGFVRFVPIDPRAAHYREWLKQRAELKKTLKDIDRLLGSLESLHDINRELPRALLTPCRGKVPLRQALEAILRPKAKLISEAKQPLVGCGKVGPKSLA